MYLRYLLVSFPTSIWSFGTIQLACVGFLQTAAHDITHSVHMLIPLGETTRNPAEELNDEAEVVDGGEDPGCACSESVWKLKP